MGEIRELKRELRRRIIQARDALDPGLRRSHSLRIARRVLGLPEMQEASTVHLFASFGSEVDTTPIIERLLETGRRPVLPVVIPQDRTMDHAAISSLADLEPGFKGIREPGDGCRRVGPDEIDLVIVPGVAFDSCCGRVGYGGGFYDRFLSTCPAPKIALAFSMQIVDGVPCDERDLPVDLVITETGIIRPSRGRS